ncbi:MAG TPA: metallophosphoesterase family protein [Xanthobacteraceae bacterium]|nr:metallophosphoesterase family protein [Xanthobacteraceae bacterium]
MRCLVVADLHYALPKFDWLLQAAPHYDLVVLAGDALDIASIVDFRAQILVVRKYLQRICATTRLIVCSGNHDLDGRGESGEKEARWIGAIDEFCAARDGDTVVIDDILFTVCPWWDGPLLREALGAQLEDDARRRAGRRWVWIHHAPPTNSPTSWSGSRSLGDAELETWIARYCPDIVISGHIHQSPFVRDGSWADRIGTSWVFNPGFQYGSPPAYIALDFAQMEAVWVSAMDVQTVRLDAALQRPIASAHEMPAWLGAGRSSAELFYTRLSRTERSASVR